ncbi:MAG: isochorismatase family protein [Armatimonadota bacterium]|nr:isochorismatase family protein [Armatimonadota bacterium]
MERWWERVFDEEERAAYATMRKGAVLPRGERPALLVIDVTRAFCGERGQTLEDAQRVWPTACGPVAWEAMPHLAALIDAARGHGVPVVYTTGQPGADRLFGGTVKGEDGPMGSPMAWPGAQQIPAEIAPRDGELVLAKPKASAFFATPLLAYLHRLATDSLIVCGTTTSGCVRATVVDGFSWGYPVFVVEEATFDRSRLSHAVNLFEMHAKYADVITVADVMEWMRRCRTVSRSPISIT